MSVFFVVILHTHPVPFFPFQPGNPTEVYNLQNTKMLSHPPAWFYTTLNRKKEKVKIRDPYIFFPIQE